MNEMASSVVPTYTPDVFDKFYDKALKFKKDLEYKRDKSAIQKAFKELVLKANFHKAKGVEKGDEAYKQIYSEIEKLLIPYCEKYKLDPSAIINQSPAVREILSWAVYNKASDMRGKIVKGITYGTVGAFVTGLLGGISTIGYHLITSWIHS